jgi:hypothetical protein
MFKNDNKPWIASLTLAMTGVRGKATMTLLLRI